MSAEANVELIAWRRGLCAGLAVANFCLTPPVAANPDELRKAELRQLLRQDCSACHGMTLNGGLGLPLRKEALVGKSPRTLQETILNGRAGTAMPAWRGLLSEEDAAWLVETLQKGRFDEQ